jgi:hypothetical protein
MSEPKELSVEEIGPVTLQAIIDSDAPAYAALARAELARRKRDPGELSKIWDRFNGRSYADPDWRDLMTGMVNTIDRLQADVVELRELHTGTALKLQNDISNLHGRICDLETEVTPADPVPPLDLHEPRLDGPQMFNVGPAAPPAPPDVPFAVVQCSYATVQQVRIAGILFTLDPKEHQTADVVGRVKTVCEAVAAREQKLLEKEAERINDIWVERLAEVYDGAFGGNLEQGNGETDAEIIGGTVNHFAERLQERTAELESKLDSVRLECSNFQQQLADAHADAERKMRDEIARLAAEERP